VPNRQMVIRMFDSPACALRHLAAMVVVLATAVVAEGESADEEVRLTVSQRTVITEVPPAGIPTPLRSPLPSMFGAPLPISAKIAENSADDAVMDPVAADSDDGGGESSGPSASAKSPGKALFLSAMLPGAGEYYAGNRKRAAIFFGLEALGWTLWSTWDGKGKDIVDEFRATAREEWNPLEYIGWRLSSRSRFSSLTHALPCSVYVVTDGVDGLADCPKTDAQQYYELIGKYDQFISGWSDLTDGNGNRIEPSVVDSVEHYNSDLRLAYETRRKDSNDFLERASTVSGLILFNHVLSAIDASRVARSAAEGKEASAIEGRTRFAFTTRDGLRGGAPILLAYKPFY